MDYVGSDLTDNLDLVPRLIGAVGWLHAGYLDRADLMQAGYVGLMVAAKRYDPSRGPFRRYAASRVLGSMRDALHVGTRGRRAESLDADISLDDDSTLHELVADRDAPSVCDLAMLALDWQRCEQAMRLLPARSRLVLDALYWRGWTGREVATALGVSESRVDQLHMAAVRGLRVLMYNGARR